MVLMLAAESTGGQAANATQSKTSSVFQQTVKRLPTESMLETQ